MAKTQTDPDQEKKKIHIGLIRTSSIGDVILASSCLQLLQQLRTPCAITWVGSNPSISLIKKAYPEIKTIVLKKNLTYYDINRLLKPVHVLIDLQGNLRSYLIKTRYTLSYGRPSYSCPKNYLYRTYLILHARLHKRTHSYLTTPNVLKSTFQTMAITTHKALQHKLAANTWKELNPLKAKPKIPLHSYSENTFYQLKELQRDSWLALAPGASFQTKKTPLNFLLKTLEFFQKKLSSSHVRIFLVGDVNDCQLAKEFEKKILWPTPILNFTGKLSLYETAIALRQAQCLLSNDSALGHLAEAVGTPVGILFGPTTEKFGFSPYKEKSKSFSAQLSCRPCSKHGKKSCRYNDKLCFTSIPKSDIVTFLLNFFKPL